MQNTEDSSLDEIKTVPQREKAERVVPASKKWLCVLSGWCYTWHRFQTLSHCCWSYIRVRHSHCETIFKLVDFSF